MKTCSISLSLDRKGKFVSYFLNIMLWNLKETLVKIAAGLQIAAYSRFCTRNILTIFSRPLLSDICMFYNVIPLTAYCQHTDIIVTAYWYHTNRILTSYWENTDSTLTFHWFHTNIKLTPTWYHTKVLLMNHWIHWIHSTIITSLHWHHTDQKCI